MKNIAYVGACRGLLDIDREVIRWLCWSRPSPPSRKLIEANEQALALGHDYASSTSTARWPSACRAMRQHRRSTS